MKFAYPWMLALLALLPFAAAAWAYLAHRASRRMASIAAPPLSARLMPHDRGGTAIQLPLMTLGLALALFAAARPQWGESAERIETKSRNVVVALDVSRSMLAGDLRPNRLERAKADIADLLDSLDSDRCALVAFRHTGALVCPLTSDRGFLRHALEGITTESAARGETDIGAAIYASLAALDPAADDHNAIILVSDGGDLRDGAVKAARAAKARSIPIFTVGLGDPSHDSTIPGPDGKGVQKYKNADVKTRLEEAPLKAVAAESGGKYVPLATAGTAETTLGSIYRRFLRQVAAKEQAAGEEMRATERFGYFLIPAIVFILAAASLSKGRFAGARKRG